MSEPAASLLALSPAEAEARFVELGGRAFHARAARKELLTRGVLDYAEMTSLPAALRERLSTEVPLLAGEEVDRSVSPDGTEKLLIRFPARKGKDENEATVETVFMPSLKPNRGATLCVSTQVGCPVACPFCASGLFGLTRNLKTHEILEQYIRGQSLGPLRRSVVMGIGEPLLNYGELKPALDAVHDEMGIGTRKITVSTVGFPERLAKIARSKPRFELAISLHSAEDDLRAELVPAMKDVPVETVLLAGDDWFTVTGREITYEYVLLGGVNDGLSQAIHLAERLGGRRCSVNLIPFNPVTESPFKKPSNERVDAFQTALADRGIVATVRWSRGASSDAACGQLRVRNA